MIISWQSLYFVARKWGMDPATAALVSLSLDGVALSLAELTLRSVRAGGNSSWSARFFILVFTGISVALNMAHASLLNKPGLAYLLYAVAPCAALVVFEEFVKHNRKLSRKMPPGPPEIGFIWWLNFPFRSYRLLRIIGARHLDRLEGKEPAKANVSDSPALIRAWAKSQGISIGHVGRIPDDIVSLYSKSIEHVNGNGQEVKS